MSGNIYNMDMTINFLLQATRVLHVGNYDEDELSMITNFMLNYLGLKMILNTIRKY